MVKVKITKSGGYVVGDGPCPMDPEEFMAMFMDKIIEAQRAGFNELGISDELIDEAKQKTINDFRVAPVLEVEDAQLLPTLDNVQF
jgi:hypothetical protein